MGQRWDAAWVQGRDAAPSCTLTLTLTPAPPDPDPDPGTPAAVARARDHVTNLHDVLRFDVLPLLQVIAT
eukprot:5606733-Prymnesium_polylepis.1